MYKVLVADDESIERRAISIILKRKTGIKLIGEANNGIDAIKKAKSLNPDIIIMDIKMPMMNGLEATKEILKTNPNIKTIILTAYDEFCYAQQALKIGAVDYLLKPARPDDLLKSLNYSMKIGNSKPATFDEKDLKTFIDVYKNSMLYEKIKIGDKIAVKIELNKIVDRSINNKVGDFKKFAMILFIKLIDFISNENNIIEDKLLELSNSFQSELNLSNDNQNIKYTLNIYLDKLFEIVSNNHELEPPILIKKAIKYIEKNYNKCITLEDVAEYVHLNPQYFSRYFKKMMNINFIDYLSKLRINLSKKLLAKTDLSINSISLKVGYIDSSYFCKVFKKIEGISPYNFRKKLFKEK